MDKLVDEPKQDKKGPGKRSDRGLSHMLLARSQRNLRPSIHDKVRRILIRRLKSQLFEEQRLVFFQVRRESMDAHRQKEKGEGDHVTKCRIPLYSTVQWVNASEKKRQGMTREKYDIRKL
jgi:hypothetical protein